MTVDPALSPAQVKDEELADLRRLTREHASLIRAARRKREAMHRKARSADRAGALREEIAGAMGCSVKTAQEVVGPNPVPTQPSKGERP